MRSSWSVPCQRLHLNQIKWHEDADWTDNVHCCRTDVGQAILKVLELKLPNTTDRLMHRAQTDAFLASTKHRNYVSCSWYSTNKREIHQTAMNFNKDTHITLTRACLCPIKLISVRFPPPYFMSIWNHSIKKLWEFQDCQENPSIIYKKEKNSFYANLQISGKLEDGNRFDKFTSWLMFTWLIEKYSEIHSNLEIFASYFSQKSDPVPCCLLLSKNIKKRTMKSWKQSFTMQASTVFPQRQRSGLGKISICNHEHQCLTGKAPVWSLNHH